MRIATPLLILLFISACQSESVELIVQPKAGESRNLNTTILSTSQQKINDEDIIITSEQNLEFALSPHERRRKPQFGDGNAF
jgi:Zn-dependent M28 family amino/carboxypeptidase